MINVLLTGASGMLGMQIFNILAVKKGYKIFTVSRKPVQNFNNHFIADIGDKKQLEYILNACEPEIVINCAAYVNLDFCERNHLQTDLLHVNAVSTLITYHSVRSLYYISTDSVFDGQRGNYTEKDIPNPLNYYALSKFKGEKEALDSGKNVYIIRTNILGFSSALGKSFFEWAYQSLSTGTDINGYSNVYFNPLYVGDFANMLNSFIEINPTKGIYNFASHSAISKYAALCKIAEFFDFKNKLINPAMLDNTQSQTLRPLNTTLETYKISKLGIHVPNVNTSIDNLCNDFLKYGFRV